MTGFYPFRLLPLAGVACAALLLSGPATAGAPAPSGVGVADSAAILMGVEVAASMYSAEQQEMHRTLLKKRLQRLVSRDTQRFSYLAATDYAPRIVRVVFDVGADGRATNVRIGKRSGSYRADRLARTLVRNFTALPGGERNRVCVLMQYGLAGHDPYDRALTQALRDEIASAVADLRAGRDGPQYDARGRIIT